ncbi:MAG: DUF4147 domain-containing protein [Planctomycetota bacterium]
MASLREQARSILDAGIRSVLGDHAVRDAVRIQHDASSLEIGDAAFELASFDRLIVVGAGKASGAMAGGLLESIGDRFPCVGQINVPEGATDSRAEGTGVVIEAVRPAGRNEPTEKAIAGTGRILDWVTQAGPRDLVVALISGGGSALLCKPAGKLTLSDQLAVLRLLSGAAADITEINTVRKHLSAVKGGHLLRAVRNSRIVTLVLSDVLGDPLDLIASGPTIPDSSTPSDALRVLGLYDSERTLPAAVYAHLEEADMRPSQTARLAPSPVFIVGNNAVAVDAAGIAAESLGFNHVMHSARSCEGEAEAIGREMAHRIRDMLRRPPEAHRQDALITGGEPTVCLAPAEIRGRGGRNQQLVLAAYEQLLALDLTDAEWSRFVVLSAGTDGEDGPTQAAGGLIDGEVLRRALALGLRPTDFLRRNDAYTFLERTDGLVMTGPTGTNVCDLRIALVARSDATQCR